MITPPSATRILWQRLDLPGQEWSEVVRAAHGMVVSGVSVGAFDGLPHRVEYAIETDADGRTRRVTVEAQGADNRTLDLVADGMGRWASAGETVIDAVDAPAALDVDLGFSPVTNSLPIWRLSPTLAVGDSGKIRVAWVLYPSLEVVLGEQWYDRLGARRWRYRSGGFEAQLDVGDDGLVDTYQGLFRTLARG
jgi:hypothetical protein